MFFHVCHTFRRRMPSTGSKMTSQWRWSSEGWRNASPCSEEKLKGSTLLSLAVHSLSWWREWVIHTEFTSVLSKLFLNICWPSNSMIAGGRAVNSNYVSHTLEPQAICKGWCSCCDVTHWFWTFWAIWVKHKHKCAQLLHKLKHTLYLVTAPLYGYSIKEVPTAHRREVQFIELY